jgi:hypothetical protein
MLLQFNTKVEVYAVKRWGGKSVLVGGQLVTLKLGEATRRRNTERHQSRAKSQISSTGQQEAAEPDYEALYLPNHPQRRGSDYRHRDFGEVMDCLSDYLDFDAVTTNFLRLATRGVEGGCFDRGRAEEGKEEESKSSRGESKHSGGGGGRGESKYDSDCESVDSNDSAESLTDILIARHAMPVNISLPPQQHLQLHEHSISIRACYALFKRLDLRVESWVDVVNVIPIRHVADVVFDPERLVGSRYLKQKDYLRLLQSRHAHGGKRVRANVNFRRFACKLLAGDENAATLEMVVRGIERFVREEQDVFAKLGLDEDDLFY